MRVSREGLTLFQFAVRNPGEIDLPFMDLTIQYFDMYLNDADDIVKRHFYEVSA